MELDTARLKERVKDLIGRMTLKEKTDLLAGTDNWNTRPVERLGIPALTMIDGPNGVRRVARGEETDLSATSFPTGVSMASSWNRELIERVGGALAEETLACGYDILLGPCVNIMRHPLAGRNFESYSEDPFLAGKIGSAFVKGVQDGGAGTSLKHYACNNQETERLWGSSVVDERTLREIYLAAFEMIVKEAKPWTVMCSYNRINGTYAGEHYHLLHEILREEWGYEGAVVSDWGANHSTVESIKAGLDLEMPGPAKYYGRLLLDAVNDRKVELAEVERGVGRMLQLILRSGKMDNPSGCLDGSLNSPAHRKLARTLADESIVLLKNENNLLPLKKETLKSLAVIGPTAASRVGGGGSSKVEPPYYITPLEALQAKLGGMVEIGYEQGCDNMIDPPIINPEYITLPDENEKGLLAEYFNNAGFSGEAAIRRVDRRFNFWCYDANLDEYIRGEDTSARWTGRLNVPDTGRHVFKLVNTGRCSLWIDGVLVLESNHMKSDEEQTAKNSVFVELTVGRTYDIRMEYVKVGEERDAILQLLFGYAPQPEEDARFERAVSLAAKSDVAVVFAGMMEDFETEFVDRTSMELPGMQNELIRAVAKANPRTVVVLNTGSPVTMPWIDEVPALLEAFYFGQEGGNAVADILLGEANPSGKLSMTFPRRLEDTPAFINYPGSAEVLYGEGIFVGYRYYDKRDIEPLFPFGFGLSYTTFEYGGITAGEEFRPGEPVKVSVTVKNNGNCCGKEVVQLYVCDRKSSFARPPRELKGFEKIALNPGESRTVQFVLDERAFSFYNPYKKEWVAEPGEFEIQIGSSSRDIRARAVVNLVKK